MERPATAEAMLSRNRRPRQLLLFLLIIGLCGFGRETFAACVWKVTGPHGGTLFLGGSIHSLRSTDYPLPSAYNRAFESSSRLVFEDDPSAASSYRLRRFSNSGKYSGRDSLKNHLDPRTYDYLRRVFGLMHLPEKDWAKLRPWALVLALWSAEGGGYSQELGVEGFLAKRAQANSMPISGLESFNEHMEIFSKMTDHQAELLLLLTFIPSEAGCEKQKRQMTAWRRGDADAVARMQRESFRDFPTFYDRLLTARNRNWIPKIERYLNSGQVYFVVAGAAHMGGPQGVIALLKARGCRVEQI